MMDGQRARRLKCGSPIGRIVDEAGDAMQYSVIALVLGYITKIEPGWLCLGYAIINLPMFCMEMSYMMCGTLKITANDDLGPIEVEIIVATIFLAAGFFGISGLEHSVQSSFAAEGMIHGLVPESLLWKHSVIVLALFLYTLFSLEGLSSCFAKDPKKTLYNLLCPAITIAIASLSGLFQTETYSEQFVVFHLVHSFSFNISSYRLMIANMTKTDFLPIGVENLVALVPIFVHVTCANKLERVALEPLANYTCLLLMVILFYGHFAMLSMQFLARNPDRKFFTIKAIENIKTN